MGKQQIHIVKVRGTERATGHVDGVPVIVEVTKQGMRRGAKATALVSRWPFGQGIPPIVIEVVGETRRKAMAEAIKRATERARVVACVRDRVRKCRGEG